MLVETFKKNGLVATFVTTGPKEYYDPYEGSHYYVSPETSAVIIEQCGTEDWAFYDIGDEKFAKRKAHYREKGFQYNLIENK